MFLLVAVCITHDKSWIIKRLPVLEQRQYSKYDWYERLGSLREQGYKQVWVTQHAIPAIRANISFRESNLKLKTIKQLFYTLHQWSKHWSTQWYNLLKYKQDYCVNDLSKQANAVWEIVRHKLEGKLLHIYELQKSIIQDHLHITLENWFDYLFIWSWQGSISIRLGIERANEGASWSKRRPLLTCARCSNTELQKEEISCYSCKQDCISCRACVQLGKVKSCSLLFSVTQNERVRPEIKDKSLVRKLIDVHQLSSAQREAVEVILNAIIKHFSNDKLKRSFIYKKMQLQYLIWAVTGAGKTEMIFPIIDLFLGLNLKVLIAIPRRDVVQELKPRISKAFPSHHVVALYGGSKQIWEEGDIYISTTHQLLRFDRYFDLVILDEMDAFPYYNNDMLVRVVKRIQNRQACFIQLTATVPKKEKLRLMLGGQHYVKVPVRYHQHPLPVPQFSKIPSLQQILQTEQVPQLLQSIILSSHKRGAVLFIFLQRKLYLQPFAQLLQHCFPNLTISYTSAEDPMREGKVKQFRDRQIDVLVTTSILERGVTIKKSDICIVDAHQTAFNRTAIVQMAGRAGRSIDDPNGYVHLLGVEQTGEIKAAIRDITSMNKLARKRGYLREE